ncbi:putative beta-galactosidase [Helianthus debilis subsp. tardiflorus]
MHTTFASFLSFLKWGLFQDNIFFSFIKNVFFMFHMWPDLIQNAKEGGLDVIQTCVFWNGHEPQPGKAAMEKFTRHIVNMMKSERLYENQGDPIILSQVVIITYLLCFCCINKW